MGTHDFPPVLDVLRAAEAQLELSGQTHLSHFSRLLAQFGPKASRRALNWKARFAIRQSSSLHDEAWLELSIQSSLPLICQRCLGEFECPVEAEQVFRFVADENIAQQEDDESVEDLLVLSRAFDLAELIEDEVIMGLPIMPRHELCPRPLARSAADRDFDQATGKENPFAALAQLKKDKAH